MRKKGFDFICCSHLHHERTYDKRDKKALYKKKETFQSLFAFETNRKTLSSFDVTLNKFKV
jgi:hypothetical protein